ncbi:MAG: S41 family peptidase [Planctomycetota bacterium]|nr:S41 family peptidase [Planctomycetota bacterium]
MYDRPVVVLVDRHCFSAAEIIAAGLQSLPQVTVVGEQTRGGAGATQYFPLPISKTEIVVTSTSVFLTSDGTLIDGQGVVPDLEAGVDLETMAGPKDTMLDRAIDEIRRRSAQRASRP